MEGNTLLRTIPKVDELMAHPRLSPLPRAALLEATRTALDALRQSILDGTRTQALEQDELLDEIIRRVEALTRSSLRHVINATGVALHTNFGRAPLAKSAAEAAMRASLGYTNLEYDLDAGARGSRYAHVVGLLQRLTGAEDVLVVNNNAAAVLLALTALAQGREVPISRGELVEIGGAFRVPEVMEQSGCILREVGATNKTRLHDYARAIDPARTALLLKVHTSNYRILGFTEEASLAELSALAKAHSLPLLYDLGSGLLLRDCYDPPLGEPTVADSLAEGADIVCFSGDKLLGGPQAGILLGRAELIAKMKKHPLTRALRIDKMTLAALEATLRLYQEPEQARAEIPALRILSQNRRVLRERAEALLARISSPGIALTIIETEGQVGGGSVPLHALPSCALALSGGALTALEGRLRQGEPAVAARIEKDRLIFDMLAVDDGELDALARCLVRALTNPV